MVGGIPSQSEECLYGGGSTDDAEQVRRPVIDPNADLVQFYFRDIRPVSSLLSFKEEQALAQDVQKGKHAFSRLRRNPAIAGDERAALESLMATGEPAR